MFNKIALKDLVTMKPEAGVQKKIQEAKEEKWKNYLREKKRREEEDEEELLEIKKIDIA
jgi:hypothetical protein